MASPSPKRPLFRMAMSRHRPELRELRAGGDHGASRPKRAAISDRCYRGSVTLAINALAIPLYGAWGCIAALIAGEVVMLGLGLSMRSKLHLLKYPIVPVVAPPLLCSLGVAAVIAMLPASYHRFWWLELTIGGLVLLLCLLGFERATCSGSVQPCLTADRGNTDFVKRRRPRHRCEPRGRGLLRRHFLSYAAPVAVIWARTWCVPAWRWRS